MSRFMLEVIILMALGGCVSNTSDPYTNEFRNPVDQYGALAVKGNRIVSENGEPVSLAGVSFFWSTTGWGEERFYNPKAVKAFADDWGVTLVRAAISVEPRGGYLTHPKGNRQRAYTIIEAAIAENLYVLVDWHSHRAEASPEAAVEFFTDIATRYGETDNVIYEIYNEPLDTADWSTVIKPYAEIVVAAIREIDPDNLIVIGTQNWSQDVDKAAADPVTGYDNLAYSLHFYAGSHGASLRAKAQGALDQGIALMVTEWGSVNYNGNGPVDYEEVDEWMAFIRDNQLSHANWSVTDKNESSALFLPGSPADGTWRENQISESGNLVRTIIREWNKQTPQTLPPEAQLTSR